MKKKKKKTMLAAFVVPMTAALLTAGALPANAVTPSSDHGGYVVVDPAAAQVTDEGVFYPTGKIGADTVVVVPEADGSLPNGLTTSKLQQLYGPRVALPASARGDSEVASQRATAAAASNYAYLASSASSWSRSFAGPNIIGADAAVTVKYRFTVASSTAQTNAGQGLGYYRGYNGSQFGTWSKWYNLGVADTRTPGSTRVPWGNVSAQTMFRAKCGTSTICSGSFSASGV